MDTIINKKSFGYFLSCALNTLICIFNSYEGPMRVNWSHTLCADVKCCDRSMCKEQSFFVLKLVLVLLFPSTQKKHQSLPNSVHLRNFGLDKRRVAINYLLQPNHIFLCCLYNSTSLLSINQIARPSVLPTCLAAIYKLKCPKLTE